MFLQINDRIIATDHIVEVEIHPAREEKVMSSYEEAAEYDFPQNNVIIARPLSVLITTTATTSEYDDGGDYPDTARVETKPHEIYLSGEEAELFLAALPVHEPVLEES